MQCRVSEHHERIRNQILIFDSRLMKTHPVHIGKVNAQAVAGAA